MDLVFGNVRCFGGDHRVPLRPLTLLVGENSTGKSTVLSLLHAALQSDFPDLKKLFNQPPFELGGFDTISTNRGGRAGRAKDFYVGFAHAEHEKLTAWFSPLQGGLTLSRLEAESSNLEVSFTSGDKNVARYRFTDKSGKRLTFQREMKLSPKLTDELRYGIFEYGLEGSESENPITKAESESLREQSMRFQMALFLGKPTVRAIAPLRTTPHRTYEMMMEDVSPGGEHVPRILHERYGSNDRDGGRLFKLLNRYGSQGGLFDKLIIRKLGNRPSDPFQVRIKTFGPDVNLMDVGYGVSQSLPIMVDVWLAGANDWVLVQQPEVHLHPRAQAALGSFFVEAVVNGKRNLVIETHSDYLLDRIRTEVAMGRIASKDVQILFFERSNFDATIWTLSLDDQGNVLDAPDCYRQFFLQEELRILARGDE